MFADTPGSVTLTVRALDVEDATEARALLLPAWDGDHPHVEAMLSRLDRAARQESAETLALTAMLEQLMVGVAVFGMVAGATGTAALHGVFVTDEIRRRGVGAALLRGVIKVLDADHTRMLIAEVPDEGSLAGYRAFLSNAGFFEESRIPDLIRDGVAMALWRKEIGILST